MHSISYTGCSQCFPTRGSSSGSTSSCCPQKRLMRSTKLLKPIPNRKDSSLFLDSFLSLHLVKNFLLNIQIDFSVLYHLKPLVQMFSVM